jgi:hypothetical protein
LNVFSKAAICVLKAYLLASQDARDYSIHHLCQQTILARANEGSQGGLEVRSNRVESKGFTLPKMVVKSEITYKSQYHIAKTLQPLMQYLRDSNNFENGILVIRICFEFRLWSLELEEI